VLWKCKLLWIGTELVVPLDIFGIKYIQKMLRNVPTDSVYIYRYGLN